jgi:integrase
MQSLTPSELLKVLKVASESKRNHCMILFAFRFGMRASEVCNLRLADIDRKNGTITIRRLKGSKTSVGHLTNVQGQPLLSAARALNAWLDERQDESDYVFTSQKGGKLDRDVADPVLHSIGLLIKTCTLAGSLPTGISWKSDRSRRRKLRYISLRPYGVLQCRSRQIRRPSACNRRCR